MALTATASLSNLPNGGALRVDSPAGPILLYREGDRVTAHSARCSHFGVAMKADHTQGVVTCWFHGAQFDLRSGENIRPPLSGDWQRKVPLGIGKVAAMIIPKGGCKPLKSFAVEVVGIDIRVSES